MTQGHFAVTVRRTSRPDGSDSTIDSRDSPIRERAETRGEILRTWEIA